MRPLLVLLAVVAANTAAGCGTTERTGAVGDELTAKATRVTLLAVDRRPPQRRDVTGLGAAAPGFRLVGAHVRACTDRDQAVGVWQFGVRLAGGASGARIKYPQTIYADGFDHVRSGCDDGWVVFEVPDGATPSAITFGHDDTGTSGPYRGMGGMPAIHARFTWTLGR